MRGRKRVAAAALLSAAALLTTTVAGAEAARNQTNGGRVKNVIYLLGDGMGRSHVTAARERY